MRGLLPHSDEGHSLLSKLRRSSSITSLQFVEQGARSVSHEAVSHHTPQYHHYWRNHQCTLLAPPRNQYHHHSIYYTLVHPLIPHPQPPTPQSVISRHHVRGSHTEHVRIKVLQRCCRHGSYRILMRGTRFHVRVSREGTLKGHLKRVL